MLRRRTMDRLVTAGLGVALCGLGGWVVVIGPGAAASPSERLYVGAALVAGGAFLIAPAAVGRLARLAAGLRTSSPRIGPPDP